MINQKPPKMYHVNNKLAQESNKWILVIVQLKLFIHWQYYKIPNSTIHSHRNKRAFMFLKEYDLFVCSFHRVIESSEIEDWDSTNWNIVYQFICRVPAHLLTNWYKMFQLVDKLVQNVPVHWQTGTKCSRLSKFQLASKRAGTQHNKLVQNVPVHFAEYQLVCWQVGTLTIWNIFYQFVNELEHFVPVCQQAGTFCTSLAANELVLSKRTGTQCSSSSNLNLNLNLSERRYTFYPWRNDLNCHCDIRLQLKVIKKYSHFFLDILGDRIGDRRRLYLHHRRPITYHPHTQESIALSGFLEFINLFLENLDIQAKFQQPLFLPCKVILNLRKNYLFMKLLVYGSYWWPRPRFVDMLNVYMNVYGIDLPARTWNTHAIFTRYS